MVVGSLQSRNSHLLAAESVSGACSSVGRLSCDGQHKYRGVVWEASSDIPTRVILRVPDSKDQITKSVGPAPP